MNGAVGFQPEDEISIRDIIQILLKGKWIVLACFVVILSVVAIDTLQQDPVYQASSTLYLNNQNTTPQLGELLGASTGNRKVANEIEIIKSRLIAGHVADQLLELQRIPGTNDPIGVVGSNPGSVTRLELAQRLRGHIAARPLSREVDIIELTATSTIPAEAALIANVYAEEYVEYNRTASRARMTASREFLAEVTDRFNTELEQSENDMVSFFVQESVVAPDEEASQLIQQVSSLQQSQYETQFELGMVQTELHTLQEELRRITPKLEDMASVGNDVVIERLNQRVAELTILAEQKYARNPEQRENPTDRELLDILSQIEAIKQQLAVRMSQLVDNIIESGGIELAAPAPLMGEFGGSRFSTLRDLLQRITSKRVDVSGLQARLDMIDERLEQHKEELRLLPNKDIILSRLERSLQTREQIYMTLIQKLQEARIAEQSELGSVDIIDAAIVPTSPVRPQVQRNLMMAGVLGLVVGIGLAFLRHALDNKIRTPDELQKKGYSVTGVIPDMKSVIKTDFEGREYVAFHGRKYHSSLITLLDPISPIAEAYRSLRINIQLSRPDKAVQTIVITSPGPGEGKTVSSINLAVTLARSGRRTVYVDADLRRPNGHKMLGVPREPGLVDLIFDGTQLDLRRFTTTVDDLRLIPAGAPVPNPAEVLGSERMQQFLVELRREFDVIVLDTPPVLAATDAVLLTMHCDATIIVCSAGDTDWTMLERSWETLREVGDKIMGVVLNRFDPKAGYWGNGYGYYGIEHHFERHGDY
ncbi:MAG: polysaccharide biosynthesis tyrosine autokinase [Rhodothermales bacterium]